jgi:GR25 family glycosyltransferase involved in LPS biosynthesis
MNKLENFGHVYLINLPDQKNRLTHIEKQFNKYNINNYTVIPAVDGRNSDLKHLMHGQYPRLRPAEIGCLASHITAIKTWLDTSDDEYGIIMEDDCSLDTVEHWQWDWNYFIKHIPKDADIIQLVMIKNNNVKFNMHRKEQYKRSDVSSYAWSTACYVIKRSYAKMLVKTFLINDKYEFTVGKYKNRAADVLLYNLGTAYSMPIFTYFLDTKNAINSNHEEFHIRSKQYIDYWWEKNSNKYSKESFFDTKYGLTKPFSTNTDLVFNIFHVDGETDILKKRTKLTEKATAQLLNNFKQIDTPTIIIKDKEQVKDFYSKEKINIDPYGHKGNGWKLGELGIWASNYSAWKNFGKSEHEMLMLMEDDIVLSKVFNEKLCKYLEELPDDWDFFTVYIPSFGNIRYKVNKLGLDIGKENVCKVYQSWSCLCYVVSKSGAKKLLKEVQKPVTSPIDHWLFYNENLNGYAIKMEKGNICDIYKMDSTVQSAEKHNMSGYV